MIPRRDDRPFRWAPAFAIATMAWLALFPITSIDAYYNLAVGRFILEHREIPSTGVFSATFGDRPWHDNEWGFQVLVAALGRTTRDADGLTHLSASGRAALIGLRAAALTATLALLALQMRRAGVDPLSRGVAVLLVAALTFNNLFWDIRPQIATYVLLAATTWLLGLDRGGMRAAPWLTLPVVAVWANLHGAFVVGIAVLWVEAAGAIVERDPRARRLAMVAALAPVAACLNPHGVAQLTHPFLYMLHPEIHAGNAEWMRPVLWRLPLFVTTVAATVVSLIAAGRPRMADALRVAVFGGLGVSALRHLPLAAVVLVPVLAEYATRASARGGVRHALLPTGPGRPVGARAAAAVLGVAAIAALSGAKFVGAVPRFEERMVRPMPEAGVRLLARAGVDGPGLNAYRFGGFLMFRQYPDARVFMDGRNDLYREFRDSVYNPLLRAAPGWREALAEAVGRWGIEWILIDAAEPLAAALAGEPGWLPGDGRPGWVTDGAPGASVVLFLREQPANRVAAARIETWLNEGAR